MTADDVWFVILILFGATMTVVAAVQTERLETVRQVLTDDVVDLQQQLGEMALRVSEAEEHAPARGAGGRFTKRAA